MRVQRRRRLATAAGLLVVSLVGVACGSGSNNADVTVTDMVTVGPTDTSASPSPTSTPAPSSSSAPSSSVGSSNPPASNSAPPSSGSGTAEPDGFVPTKLKPGEKPPQFVVVSFDGVGWHEKWELWKGVEAKVPFHFTGFLSGTYMLSDQTKDKYKGPGHKQGASDINWNTPADLPVEIADLNGALARGNEIGTHFNGHFCGPGGGSFWNTDDWNNELDQFFSFVKNVNANNGISDKLNLPASEIKGERTPCLEGHAEDLFPALKAHGMTYDSSFTKRGISWPTQSKENKIWQIGMAEFPIHGTLSDRSPVDPDKRANHFQITMDYNFWYSQNGASSNSTPEQSKQDSQQVLDTYRDMLSATFNGNRAPLILGNHFNSWNNGAYSDAIENFVLETCGKPEVKCVPFRDLIAWMNAQDPSVLAHLQQLPPELAAR